VTTQSASPSGGNGDRGASARAALDGAPAVAHRFIAHGGRLSLEVRERGAGAPLPFALIGDVELELRPGDLEWLCAVAPRAQQIARKVAV
jgi:hypothetical protein